MLDLLTNAPREVTFGPRTLKVGALKLKELGQLQRWIRDHSMRPLVRLKEELSLHPEEDHRALRLAALRADKAWPPSINSAEGNAVLFDDPDGQAYFLAVMLRKYQEVDDATLDEIAAGLSEIDFGVLVQIAFGEDDLDPKAAKEAALQRLEAIKAAYLASLEAPAQTGESSSTDSGPSLPT